MMIPMPESGVKKYDKVPRPHTAVMPLSKRIEKLQRAESRLRNDLTEKADLEISKPVKKVIDQSKTDKPVTTLRKLQKVRQKNDHAQITTNLNDGLVKAYEQLKKKRASERVRESEEQQEKIEIGLDQKAVTQKQLLYQQKQTINKALEKTYTPSR